MKTPVIGESRECRLPSSLLTVGPPQRKFGNLLWAPVNKLAVDLVGLLSEGGKLRENLSERHLEKLEAMGFAIEAVWPGMDRGVDWKATRGGEG